MVIICFIELVFIVLIGGNFKVEIEYMKIYFNKLYFINEGEILKFNEISCILCVYLVVGGGFKLEKWFYLVFIDFNVEIGGFEGRKFKKGDEIELKYYYF